MTSASSPSRRSVHRAWLSRDEASRARGPATGSARTRSRVCAPSCTASQAMSRVAEAVGRRSTPSTTSPNSPNSLRRDSARPPRSSSVCTRRRSASRSDPVRHGRRSCDPGSLATRARQHCVRSGVSGQPAVHRATLSALRNLGQAARGSIASARKATYARAGRPRRSDVVAQRRLRPWHGPGHRRQRRRLVAGALQSRVDCGPRARRPAPSPATGHRSVRPRACHPDRRGRPRGTRGAVCPGGPSRRDDR